MTLALRQHLTLVEGIDAGDPGGVDMSPVACILGDGTILAASVRAGTPYYTEVWHLSHAGQVLGSGTLPAANYPDIGLAALGDATALLMVTDDGDTRAVPVTASGGAVSFGTPTPTGGPQQFFTGGQVARFYHVHDGLLLLNGWNGPMLYTTAGQYIGSGTNTHPAIGWGVDPTNPARVAIARWRGVVRSYLMTPGALIEEPIEQNYDDGGALWEQGASNPYVTPRRVLANDSNPLLHFMVRDALTGNELSRFDPEVLSDFLGVNVEWATSPIGAGGDFLTVVEYDEQFSDSTRDKYSPVVLKVEGAAITELRLDYGGRQVSVSYGSYTWDVRSGTAVLISSTTNHVGPDEHRLNLYILDIGTPTVEGRLAIDTHDHPFHVVGTRDPAMPYELVIDTGTERLVEIVAGEETLATHELVIDETGRPGTPWSHCGLFRPV